MARKIYITEKQRQAIEEVLTQNVNVQNGDVSTAVNNAKQEVQQSGQDPSTANYLIQGKDINEGRCFTKKEIEEARVRVLRRRAGKFNNKKEREDWGKNKKSKK